MTKLLMIASEGLPFVKTGGLADVIGSLPQALAKEKIEVSVVMPLYLKTARNERSSLERLSTFKVHIGIYNTVATIFKKRVLRFCFIQNHSF